MRTRRTTAAEVCHRYRSARPFIGAVVVIMMVVSATTAAFADNTTTTTSSTTTTTLPPAPAGFASSVVAVYQAEFSTAQGIGETEDVLSVGQFAQEIDNLDTNDLAGLYYGIEQVPEWNQIPSLMQTIADGVPTPTAPAAFRSPAKGSRPATHMVLAAAVFPPSSSAGSRAVLTGSAGPYQPQTCPSGPSDAAVFAATIVLDVAYGVYNAVSALDDAAAASVISAAAVLVAQLVHDILAYEQLPAQECQQNNVSGYVANIDNTTVTTYGLIAELANTVVPELQGTDNTTLQDVENIQTELTVLQQTFESTLLGDTQTLQSTIGSDTEATLSELQTIQSALSTDVNCIEADETTVGQQVSAEVDKDSAAVQTSLAGALSQILHETDADAQGLTTLVTQGDQQILNDINSQFSTAQQQYEENLKIGIEQALAGWGPVVPQVQYTLPVLDGGFLNSTPVGVQETVTSDLQVMQSLGVKVKAAAVTDLAAANTALAAGQYLTAFADYAGAYQALA